MKVLETIEYAGKDNYETYSLAIGDIGMSLINHSETPAFVANCRVILDLLRTAWEGGRNGKEFIVVTRESHL